VIGVEEVEICITRWEGGMENIDEGRNERDTIFPGELK